MAGVVAAPDSLPWLAGSRRVALFRQRGEGSDVLADAHGDATGPRSKLHPFADAEGGGAELVQACGLAGCMAEVGGRGIVAGAICAWDDQRRPHGG